MQTGKATMKDVFDGSRIFNVPIYQRAFSWRKEDNLKEFLIDILNQHAERNYFLGTFLFHRNGKRNEFELIDIVDGQQRLTTFVIFINILIQILIKKSSKLVSERTKRIYVKDDDVYKIELSNEDSAFLHNCILNSTDYEHINYNSPSQRLLLEAKNYFTNELAKYDLSTLEKIYNTSTNTDVLLYVVDKINTAIQIFELINDRGRRLTDLESIKSFLMYNAGLISGNPDQIIKNIQTEFAEIYRLIEKHDIDDSDILRYHTIAFEGCPADYLERPKEFTKNKINSLALEKNTKTTAIQEIERYSSRLKNSFVTYSKIQEEKNTCELSQFFMIGRIKPFYPALIRIYKENNDQFITLLKVLNRFTFRASLIGLRSNGESYIYTKLRNSEDVIAQIDSFTKDNWWNINNRALEAIEYENYYEWLNKNIVRYILFSYENKLRKEKGFPILGLKEYYTNINRERLSIEHISAQRAKNVEYDEDFRKSFLHSIGNLVIDFQGSNSSKGSSNTKEKISAYNLAPLMSQNEIDEIRCDWENIKSIMDFIRTREKTLKMFIKDDFLSNHSLVQ